MGRGGIVVVFDAFGAKGRWFESHSSRHVRTLGRSVTRSCLYDVIWALRGCLTAKFDCCNSLLSSVHTLLVNILRCVRLYIKNENKINKKVRMSIASQRRSPLIHERCVNSEDRV